MFKNTNKLLKVFAWIIAITGIAASCSISFGKSSRPLRFITTGAYIRAHLLKYSYRSRRNFRVMGSWRDNFWFRKNY
jgi:hypothetical protein